MVASMSTNFSWLLANRPAAPPTRARAPPERALRGPPPSARPPLLPSAFPRPGPGPAGGVRSGRALRSPSWHTVELPAPEAPPEGRASPSPCPVPSGAGRPSPTSLPTPGLGVCPAGPPHLHRRTLSSHLKQIAAPMWKLRPQSPQTTLSSALAKVPGGMAGLPPRSMVARQPYLGHQNWYPTPGGAYPGLARGPGQGSTTAAGEPSPARSASELWGGAPAGLHAGGPPNSSRRLPGGTPLSPPPPGLRSSSTVPPASRATCSRTSR